MKTLKLTDEVVARIAQIIQESLLTGTDAVEKIKAVELCKHGKDELVLTDEYKKSVSEDHERLMSELMKKAEEARIASEKERSEQPRVFRLTKDLGIMQLNDDEKN